MTPPQSFFCEFSKFTRKTIKNITYIFPLIKRHCWLFNFENLRCGTYQIETLIRKQQDLFMWSLKTLWLCFSKIQFFIFKMQNISNLIGQNSEQIFDIFNSCNADINEMQNAWLVQQWTKKVALFPEIGRVKIFYHLPVRIVKYVSEYIFLVSKNTKTSKKTRIHKKQKKLKKERQYLRKIN